MVAPQTDVDGATALAGRLREAVAQAPVSYNGVLIAATVSVGFAVAEAGVASDSAALRHLASAALTEAKAAGRNRCVVRPLLLPPGQGN